MTVKLVVMDSYAEHFVIFAYVLMDHLVKKDSPIAIMQKKKKKKTKYSLLYIIM